MAVLTTQEGHGVSTSHASCDLEGTKKRQRVKQTTAVSDSSSSDESSAVRNRRRRRRRNASRRSNTGRNAPKKKERNQQNHDLLPEEQSLHVALDCEMVGVGPNGHHSAVARVTVVGWNGDLIFDEYVKPDLPVTDYRTFVSGVTPADLERAPFNLEICRERVLELLEGRILVGHGLKNDLRALGISHPWFRIRDTAKYEPFMRDRFGDGILWPRKLKELAYERLEKRIQISGEPHSSYEDAAAAMDLYRSVRRKWEKAIAYKIKKTNQIQLMKSAI